MRSQPARTVLAALVSLLLGPGARADDWPVYGRDRTGNAVSPEKNPPTDWHVKASPKVLQGDRVLERHPDDKALLAVEDEALAGGGAAHDLLAQRGRQLARADLDRAGGPAAVPGDHVGGVGRRLEGAERLGDGRGGLARPLDTGTLSPWSRSPRRPPTRSRR